MKRIIAILTAMLVLLCPMCMAEENWYASAGTDLAERVIALAGDESYAEMYTGMSDIQAIVAEFAASDFSEIKEARILSLPDEKAMGTIMKLLGGIADAELSPVAEQELFRRIPGMLITLVNGQHSHSWLGATSILTTSETYVMPEAFQPGVLLLEYPGEYSVAVAFSRTGEETVTASATAVHSGFREGVLKRATLLERLAIELMFRKIDPA